MPGKQKAYNTSRALAEELSNYLSLSPLQIEATIKGIIELDIRATVAGFKSPLGAMRKEALGLIRQRSVQNAVPPKKRRVKA